MANEIANLVVEISADAKKLNQELKLSEQNIQSFSARAANNFKLIGAALTTGAIITGLGLFARHLSETAKSLDDLGDSAQALGLTTAQLQKLKFQAEQAGSSAEGVAGSFVFMQNAIVDAARGSQQQVDAFNKLGLSAARLKQLSPEQQFEQIAGAFSKVKNSSEQIDLARTIFGRAGVDQINLLNSDLARTSKLFDDMNLGLSESQARNIDELDKTRKLFDEAFGSFSNKLAADLAPGFSAIEKGILKTIDQYGGLDAAAKFVSVNIVKYFGAIAEATELLARPFNALGTLSDFVKLAGTNIGVTIGQLSHGQDVGKAAFRGEIPLPLPGDPSQKALQETANEILDARAKTLDESISHFSDTKNFVEKLVTNIEDAYKESGDKAGEASKKVDRFKASLDAINGTGGPAPAGKTALETSLKKGGANAGFSDEENTFLQGLKGFSKINPMQTEEQLRESAVGKLAALNTPEANQAISDIYAAVEEKNHPGSRLGNLKPGGGVSGYGSISDENGKFMSVGTPQNIVVTVVLVPDEGRLFNAVVDSQIFQRAVVDTSNKNLMNVTRSDRS